MPQSHLSVGFIVRARRTRLTYLPGASELVRNHLWLEGPDWLRALHVHRPMSENGDIGAEIPEECLQEMNTKKATHTLVAAQDHGSNIGQLLSCGNFSSLYRLLRVTALVLKFVRVLR